MVIIDPIRMGILRKVFPEINEVKVEVFTLFAFGMTVREISDYRNTTPQSVYKTLKELCAQYSALSNESLKTLYITRLVLHSFLDLRIELQSEP
ncbi:TPA: conjugal transfer protein TraJ [Salmonella enterica subsp. salamae serovar 28:r:e,n,z15]|nr:conjugal transfer protein TraJ [Salmonella enterica subsp. salamae serovar 28:r:e,n,z15]